MKWGPFLAIIFAFFLIAIFPYYAGNDEPSYIISDEDGDGITDDKDKCPREAAPEGQDIDEDGCTDKAITKEEISYLEKIAKFNLAQHLLFSIIAIVSGAVYWEREKIRNILYEEDKFPNEFKKASGNDKASENVDYDDLGEDKVYNEQTGSIFDGFKFSFSGFNAEADRGVQIISLICLVCFLIGPNQAWLQVDNTTTADNQTSMPIHSGTTDEFNAIFFSDYWEITTAPNGTEVIVNNKYENPDQCTAEVMDVYNCNYRISLFSTMKQLLTLSALFCFIVFILNFRAEKYRRGIAIFFTLCLVTTMASLLLFTSTIDNAIESDQHLLDHDEELGTCWMGEPRIWGETECMVLIDDTVYTDKTTFTPGISFWIILTTVSILFVGLFTSIEPLLTMEKRTWSEAMRQNWQVFAMIFAIFFLWRLNELISKL